jgi:flagellar biosynthesis GTPase FlhF
MVLGAAAELKKMGKKTLVLSLHPGHAGEIRRLQNSAANLGFDAAIIRKDGQLARSESHMAKYEAVLLDMPDLSHPSLAVGGQIHRWLCRNPSFHRHLVMPLDRDFRDVESMKEAARVWNCDWLAVSRLDRTTMTGKILDLAESIPLPYSLCGELRNAEPQLSIATSGNLLDRILSANSPIEESEFVPGPFVGQEMADSGV